MSRIPVCCAVVLFVSLVSGTFGAVRQTPEAAVTGATSTVGNGFTGTTESIAGALPKVPEAPLPAVAGPSVPLVGSSAPHTASPAVCGILGGVIVLNWIIACCCAGAGAAGAGAAAAEAEAGDTKDAAAAGVAGGVAGSIFACVECAASICSIIALFYAGFTGLFRAWLGGQAVSGWCLAMAIISTLQLLACVCICCCATCGSAILGDALYHKWVNEHSKHVFGSHMHDMVHKHKPDGTHPITEGHLPIVGHPSGKQGKDSTEATPLQADTTQASS